MLTDEEIDALVPDPRGPKVKQWAVTLAKELTFGGSRTKLGMGMDFMNELLFTISDATKEKRGEERVFEAYEEGVARVGDSPSRDVLKSRRERAQLRAKRKEMARLAALAPPPSASLDAVSSSILLAQRLEEERRQRRLELERRRCQRPPCPCGEDPCRCPCPLEEPCYVEPEEEGSRPEVPALPLLPTIFGQRRRVRRDGAGADVDEALEELMEDFLDECEDEMVHFYEMYEDYIIGYYDDGPRARGIFSCNMLAEEFFRDCLEYKARFRRDDNETPDIPSAADEVDLEDFFGYYGHEEPDVGKEVFEKWKEEYHSLLVRAFGTTKEKRSDMKRSFFERQGRKPWYPPDGETVEAFREEMEEEEVVWKQWMRRRGREPTWLERMMMEQMTAGAMLESKTEKKKAQSEEEEDEFTMMERCLCGQMAGGGGGGGGGEQEEFFEMDGRKYKLTFLKDGIGEEMSTFDCRSIHCKNHFMTRQPMKLLPILDLKGLCNRIWHLDLSDVGLEVLSGLGVFPFIGYLNLSNNNLDWNQLNNIHNTGVVELILCGNPPLEREHFYRFHLIDMLPKVWMIDGHMATSTERCKVSTWFALKGLDAETPVYHKISPHGVFATTAQKKMEADPLGFNFNPKAYKFMGSIPDPKLGLMRSPDIDKIKLRMIRRELQEALDKNLRKACRSSRTASEFRVGIRFDFLDRLQQLRGDAKLNFLILLLLVLGVYPPPIWLLKEILAAWDINFLAGLDIIYIFRLPGKWKVRIIAYLLAEIQVERDFNGKPGMSPWLMDCLYCGLDWLVRHLSPRVVVTSQYPERHLARDRKRERHVMSPRVQHALAVEAALVLTATPKTLRWMTDDRWNKSAKNAAAAAAAAPTRFSAEVNPATQLHSRSLQRICRHATVRKNFYRALQKYAEKIKDPDRVFKVLISFIKSPSCSEFEYPIKRGPLTTMMDPLTYLRLISPIRPRESYEPRVLHAARLLTIGQPTTEVAAEVITDSPVLEAMREEEWRKWRRLLGCRAGEEVFVDRAFAGEIQAKPEKQLAMLKILHPPDAHFTPDGAPFPYPLQRTCYSFQNVSKLRKRFLSRYDVYPYEDEKLFIPDGWELKGRHLLPRPRPPRHAYGLPRLAIAKPDRRIPDRGVNEPACLAGRTATTAKAVDAVPRGPGVAGYRAPKGVVGV